MLKKLYGDSADLKNHDHAPMPGTRSPMLELLQLPFMQRAILAGLVLGVLLAYLGIFVTLRKMAFFSDGIAHAALAGAAIGLLTRFSPLLSALIFSMLLAALVYWLEKKSSLSSDAIIGIMFTSGMALGVVLISLRRGLPARADQLPFRQHPGHPPPSTWP